MDVAAVMAAVIGGGGIGLFLANAHKEKVAAEHRAYEKEMAEFRDFYAALAMVRRLRPPPLTEDEEALSI